MNIAARITIVCALLLAGTVARAKEARSADFGEGDIGVKALVLLSTSNWNTPSAAPGKGKFLGIRVTLKRIGPEDGVRQKTQWLEMDNPFIESHVSSGHALVHWRALEPGEYALDFRLMNAFECQIKWPSYRFTVKAGDVIYLGDLHYSGTGIELRDQYARDLDYFSKTAGGVKPARFELRAPVLDRLASTCPGQ
jgi:hypothetical protein